MTRVLFRVLLGSSTVIALAVAVVSVSKVGATDPVAWATVAASLAVVAAGASAWTSQRVVEMQEDVQQPNPVPVLDLRSRYQMVQLRITNHGGAPAHDVRITWDRPLEDSDGKEVLLGRDVPVPVIPQGESASVLLGVSHAFMAKHKDTTFKGTITFRNPSGRRFSIAFVVSGEHERQALVHDEEGPKMQYELQKVPEALARIAAEIAGLGHVLARGASEAPSNNELQLTEAPGQTEGPRS